MHVIASDVHCEKEVVWIRIREQKPGAAQFGVEGVVR